MLGSVSFSRTRSTTYLPSFCGRIGEEDDFDEGGGYSIAPASPLEHAEILCGQARPNRHHFIYITFHVGEDGEGRNGEKQERNTARRVHAGVARIPM